MIAGPWVSSAIRNQFNLVAGTLANGIDKGSWETDGTGGGDGALTDADIVDPVHGMAFAVYSADDHSLMFYKRKGLPKVGDMFNSRRVTQVYTGFETAEYYTTGYDPKLDNWWSMTANTPWFDVRNKVLSVKAVDPGISPNSLSYYFYRFENVITIDLSNFSFQSLTSFEWALSCDYRLETVKLPSFTQRCKRFNDSVVSCHALTVLDIAPSDFSGASTFFHMFMSCRSLKFDCTDWNVRSDVLHTNFNSGSPGVIAPTVWTAK